MRIELMITTITKTPIVPPAVVAICELVGLELSGVAGEADAPAVVSGFEVVDGLGEVDVVVFELDEPIRLAESKS